MIITLDFPDVNIQPLKDALDNDPDMPPDKASGTYKEKGSYIIDKLLRGYVKTVNGNTAVAALASQYQLDCENAKNVSLAEDFVTLS